VRLLFENWRKFLTEQEEQELEGFIEFDNVGQLKKALKQAVRNKKLRIAQKAGEDIFGSTSDIASAGMTAILRGIWKASQKNPKLAAGNPGLDKLMIDPEISKVVDDQIEDKFFQELSSELAGKEDDDRLEDMDMTRMLSKYIMKDYDGTIVTPRKQKK